MLRFPQATDVWRRDVLGDLDVGRSHNRLMAICRTRRHGENGLFGKYPARPPGLCRTRTAGVRAAANTLTESSK